MRMPRGEKSGQLSKVTQLTGVAPASQILRLVPDHHTFPLQDKNKISKSGAWRPGPEEDRIP